MQIIKWTYLIAFIITGCSKKTPSDPFISLRSRETRLVGKWDIIRYYYYNGNKSGKDNSGDPYSYIVQLNKNGEYNILDSNLRIKTAFGYWNWVYESEKKQNHTRIIIGKQRINTSGGQMHILERLSYTQIRTREYFDVSDEKRYMIYEWKRRE